MPFKLTNALAIFQPIMNNNFLKYLDDFEVIYLDGNSAFSTTIILETPCMFRVGEVLRLWIIYQIGETSYKIYNKELLAIINAFEYRTIY